MTEPTRGQKLASALSFACETMLYDDPRKMLAFNAVVEAIDNSYPNHALDYDQPTPTITEEMIYSAESVYFNSEQDYYCLVEEFLKQQGWTQCQEGGVWIWKKKIFHLTHYHESCLDAYETEQWWLKLNPEDEAKRIGEYLRDKYPQPKDTGETN